MKLLIDTNVILDMVFKRKGCDISMELFRKARETDTSTYITASTVTDIFYIIRKETHNTNRTYAIMENIFRLTAVLSVTGKDIHDAFGQKWKDFEDCVQYVIGKNNNMDYIITENCKDYSDTVVPVMTPAAWIDLSLDMEKNE